MWLFDNAKRAWHLWVGLPLKGEKSLCGVPKTDEVTQQGDGVSNSKCPACDSERSKAAGLK